MSYPAIRHTYFTVERLGKLQTDVPQSGEVVPKLFCHDEISHPLHAVAFLRPLHVIFGIPYSVLDAVLHGQLPEALKIRRYGCGLTSCLRHAVKQTGRSSSQPDKNGFVPTSYERVQLTYDEAVKFAENLKNIKARLVALQTARGSKPP